LYETNRPFIQRERPRRVATHIVPSRPRYTSCTRLLARPSFSVSAEKRSFLKRQRPRSLVPIQIVPSGASAIPRMAFSHRPSAVEYTVRSSPR
jgi:hypothetical protein